jgi:ABC-type multidrug transport system fused ATPase/permease subunit
LCTAALGIVLVIGSLKASRNIHSTIVNNLLAAPFAYFQRQPVGRIINRMTLDVQAVDVQIMNCVDGLVGTGTGMIASLCLVAVAAPITIIAIVPFIIVVLWAQARFRV